MIGNDKKGDGLKNNLIRAPFSTFRVNVNHIKFFGRGTLPRTFLELHIARQRSNHQREFVLRKGMSKLNV